MTTACPACPVCGGSEWDDFLRLETEGSLTTDQRIVQHTLDKVICASCGLVRNRAMRGGQRLDDYENEYALNTTGGEEHIYFTADGQHTRSRAIFDWMKPHLPENPATVTEIGCGMGNLLEHLAQHYHPRTAIIGIEGNRQAAEFARRRHADIRQQFVGRDELALPQSDLIIAYGVAEHVEDLEGFIEAIRAGCRVGGTVILCVPVQDHGGYDVFFSDHIWHFTLAQFAAALERQGFEILAADAASPVVLGFGLVCARAGKASDGAVSQAARLQMANRDLWRLRLANADRVIRRLAGKQVALYGASEVLSLLMAYTSLGDLSVIACLDEDPTKIGRLKHGIAMCHPDYLKQHPVDAVLLTVNTRYNEQIKAKLAPLGLPVLSVFD